MEREHAKAVVTVRAIKKKVKGKDQMNNGFYYSIGALSQIIHDWDDTT